LCLFFGTRACADAACGGGAQEARARARAHGGVAAPRGASWWQRASSSSPSSPSLLEWLPAALPRLLARAPDAERAAHLRIVRRALLPAPQEAEAAR
jgi:hypothetical protein